MKTKLIVLFLLALALVPLLTTPTTGAQGDLGSPASRVGWARLKVPGPLNVWRRHAEADPVLAHFLHTQTTLNIDQTWYFADVENLEEMVAYPLLFAQSIADVTTAGGKSNMAEYVRRGGFLLIDQCCNRGINPDDSAYLLAQQQMLAEILPEARVELLPNDHEIYRACFEIKGGPPHTYFNNIWDEERSKRGLYGIMIGDRMAGVITLSGLQCGWAGMIAPAGHDVKSMKMAMNIYIYAMLQSGN